MNGSRLDLRHKSIKRVGVLKSSLERCKLRVISNLRCVSIGATLILSEPITYSDGQVKQPSVLVVHAAGKRLGKNCIVEWETVAAVGVHGAVDTAVLCNINHLDVKGRNSLGNRDLLRELVFLKVRVSALVIQAS